MMKSVPMKLFLALLFVALGLASFLLIGDKASSPEFNQQTIRSIDQKKEKVIALSAATAAASVGVSAIPDDTATPIAEKLSDFTEYFLVILTVLFTEKYLLTIFGFAAFKILIPVACILLIVALFKKKDVLNHFAVKMVIFALALYILIPVSTRISDMIYKTYETSINDTISNADSFSKKTDQLSEAKQYEGGIAAFFDSLKESVTSLTEQAGNVLNRFVETVAILIVTCCVIPLLTVIAFYFLIKKFFGLDPLPINRFLPGRFKHIRQPAAEELPEDVPRIEGEVQE